MKSTPSTNVASYSGKVDNSEKTNISFDPSLYGDWITVNKYKKGQRKLSNKEKPLGVTGGEIHSNIFQSLRNEEQHESTVCDTRKTILRAKKDSVATIPKMWVRKCQRKEVGGPSPIKEILKTYSGPFKQVTPLTP
ncbi:hypothetical protein SESBI_30527 [Sesbania bispinosa]|nr:hypothetical protein SESBI_30527 [Sesbania bispinosa]